MNSPVTVLRAGPATFTQLRRKAIAGPWPLIMLFSRSVLFVVFQMAIAGVLALRGAQDALIASAAWWPLVAALASLTCLVLLRGRLRAEGVSIKAFLGFERRHLWRDLLAVVVIFAVSGPLSMIPNILVARWLFGSETVAGALLFSPLPHWAALLAVVAFPLTVGLSELPVYFGYVMPRLEARWASMWPAYLAAAIMLAAQHCALPLILDWRFITYRLLMFLPFALWIGACLRWRPRLLPYMMIGHALIDLSTAPFILAVAMP